MLSENDIKTKIEEANVKTIYLQFTDINGKAKYISVPSEQIDNILNGEIMFDGSFIGGKRENETMDLKIVPDLSTFLVFPFKHLNTMNIARFICDIKRNDGTEFEGCVRTNLKRITKLAEEQGYKMKIGPEVEFFLFKTDENDILQPTNAEKTGYYDINHSNLYSETLLNIIDELQNMGYEIESLHHEGAPFQHEIDLGHDDVLSTADKLITFKFVVKTIAQKYGYKATFMPKPILKENGSGLHLNLSIVDKDGNNVFYDEKSQYQLSKIAKNSIASLLKNIKGITAILNPTINSYKRLVKDYEAPIYIAWSVVTRSALVRIPSTRGDSTRIELRSPDCATNPYLAFAVILQTCLYGIRNDIDAPKPIEKNLFLLSQNEIKQRKIKSLPRNMYTALEEFEKSYVVKMALGDYIFEKFLENKRIEWNEYRKQITPWEVKNYLDI